MHFFINNYDSLLLDLFRKIYIKNILKNLEGFDLIQLSFNFCLI